ncbi:MAG: hypothetical protein COA78_02710 [Blastopirellula sp.]|nr:MAG: hypothetical protein COA78_02710 [Blastopirellula sp.]
MAANEDPDALRVVLLGASNIVRGFSTIIDVLEHFHGPKLNVMAATGHGRSYGNNSRVLFRTLPGIIPSELWNAIEKQPQQKTIALVTDIGNDLLYDAKVEAIANWVEVCLKKMKKISSQIIVTSLPVCNLEKLSSRRFVFFRSCLFPKSKLTFSDAKQRAHDLNQEVERLANNYDCNFKILSENWYGIDPIHIAADQKLNAWNQILANHVEKENPVFLDKNKSFQPLRYRLAIPHERQLFGFSQTRTQPYIKLASGTCVSLY